MKTFLTAITILVLTSVVITVPIKTNDELAKAPFESFGEGPLFYLDYATFQGSDSLTYVEFYFQVAYSNLQFIKDGDKFKAGYRMEFYALDENQQLVESYKSEDYFHVNTYDETQSIQKARASLSAFSLKPGPYTIKVILEDTETLKSSIISTELYVRSFAHDYLQLSEIQFSQKISPAEEGQPYVKNHRFIEPNAVRCFAHGLADVYVYFEVYNLSLKDKFPSHYKAKITVFDQENNQVGRIERTHTKPGMSSAHSLRLPVSHFLGGTYKLVVKIEDTENGAVDETSKSFTVLSWPLSENSPDFY